MFPALPPKPFRLFEFQDADPSNVHTYEQMIFINSYGGRRSVGSLVELESQRRPLMTYYAAGYTVGHLLRKR